jgi:hypothetical protein
VTIKVTILTISQCSNQMLEAELDRQIAKGRKQNSKLVKAIEAELASRKVANKTSPLSIEDFLG